MDQELEKQIALDAWNRLKFLIHSRRISPKVKEGEVWWCSMGENVGTEINGKGEKYARPILVYRKLGSFQFLGIPLSTQEHTGSWYVNFRFQKREQYAALNQIRTVNTSRLLERMGMVDKSDMRKVRDGFTKLYC